MKWARILLGAVGAVMCVASVLLFTHLIDVFDRVDEPKPTTQTLAARSPPTQEADRLAPTEIAPQQPEAAAASPTQEADHLASTQVAPQQPEASAASPIQEADRPASTQVAPTPIQEAAPLALAEIAPQEPDQLDELRLDPPAQNSRHAIAPDAEPPAADASPSTKTESPATAEAVEVPSRVQAPSPAAPKNEFVTVTSTVSVRNGPSASAEIIGTAHAGARARVASRDSGWAQIVDPASGNTGWLDSGVLVPSATSETAAPEESTGEAPDTALDDQSAGTSKREHSKHAAKAKHHRANHHYYGRPRFAFRFFFRSFRR
jgi:uncharacterized protein YraI